MICLCKGSTVWWHNLWASEQHKPRYNQDCHEQKRGRALFYALAERMLLWLCQKGVLRYPCAESTLLMLLPRVFSLFSLCSRQGRHLSTLVPKRDKARISLRSCQETPLWFAHIVGWILTTLMSRKRENTCYKNQKHGHDWKGHSLHHARNERILQYELSYRHLSIVKHFAMLV